MSKKVNVEFLNNEMLNYAPTITLYFEPELSNGSINDTITFLNVPAMSIIERSMHINSNVLAPDIINEVLKSFKTELFEKRTVGELVSGYKDPLLTFANKFLPKIIKDDKFGFFNGVYFRYLYGFKLKNQQIYLFFIQEKWYSVAELYRNYSFLI